MKVIVGLGNPGEKYKLTRHNIGANVAKKLASSNGISLRRKKFLSLLGEGRVNSEEVGIILPLTYMNLSGKAVYSFIKYKKVLLSDTLVICDDADLKLGDIRIRPEGSDGGHRGLRSIIENLKTTSFPRLRVGIGREGNLTDHVLAVFGKNEIKKVKEVEERAVEATICWLKDGIAKAMNTYNARNKG